MKRFGNAKRAKEEKGYQVFKGYSVKTKGNKTQNEEHYVVPWELTKKDMSKKIH